MRGSEGRMFSVLLSLLVSPVLSDQPWSVCHLPTGSPGLCVPVSQCGHLTALLANLQSPLPKDVALIIRESFFCGRLGGSVAVCCPPAGVLPPGLLTPLSSCTFVLVDYMTCESKNFQMLHLVLGNTFAPYCAQRTIISNDPQVSEFQCMADKLYYTNNHLDM